uniref:C-type lectin domain-containing protein n=1 Tax=Terrapene triunguis TaxID=2587831 RepID=A0A674JSN4_9SAUR
MFWLLRWNSLCQEHWFQRGKKCYLFSTEYKSWLESRKACSSHGSRLLLIEGKEELDFINPLAAFHWIGLSLMFPSPLIIFVALCWILSNLCGLTSAV